MSSSINNDGNLSCFHLSELRSQIGPHPFHSSPHLRKHHVLQCHTCQHPPHVLTSLYACLTCAQMHCTLHAQLHAAHFPDSSHSIAVDVDRLELYCCLCKDQVYDKEFDATVIVVAAGRFAGAPPENTLKRRRVEYTPWEPGQTENDLIVENSTPLPSHGVQLSGDRAKLSGNQVGLSSGLVELSGNQAGLSEERVELSGGGVEVSGGGVEVLGDRVLLSDNGVELSGECSFPWGLRGLNNLGNTCFMNSVLQALIHTPPLRNYFLSDKHNRYVCKKNSNVVVTMKDDEKLIKEMKDDENINMKKNTICLACELDAMFSVAFSGGKTPFTPAKFLYSWWQHASNLASYEQQDAHEFFISILDGVHEKLQMNQGKPQSQGVRGRSLLPLDQRVF